MKQLIVPKNIQLQNKIIFDNDTLSIIFKEHLNPVVSLNLGKYKLNKEKAKETIEGMIYSEEPDSENLKQLNNYFIVNGFQFTEDRILVTSIYGETKYSDFYNIQTGEILNRFESEKDFNGTGMLVWKI